MKLPIISLTVIVFGLIFLLVKNRFGITFRVKKSAVIIAVVVLAVLFWPYQY